MTHTPKTMELTQARLKEFLHYDPTTGGFTRKKTRCCRIKPGDAAGHVRKTDGYVRIKLHTKAYLAHRLAFLYMTGTWPKSEIDHVNRVRHDNRWVNLREANRSENNWNVSKRIDNTSGTPGVAWHKQHSKWVAHIRLYGIRKHLGYFDKLIDARRARFTAERMNFGEFQSTIKEPLYA